MRKFIITKEIKLFAIFFVMLSMLFLETASAFAMTKEELLPEVFKILGHDVPAARFSDGEGGAVTKSFAVRLALESIGWSFVITAYDQVAILPEWSENDSVTEIAKKMTPPVPPELLSDFDEPLAAEDLPAFKKWLKECTARVQWRDSFSWEGTTLTLYKYGVGDPFGPADGNMKNTGNAPFYAAMLTVDMKTTPCQIATAEMIGSKKATLATIATENYNVIGGINGGYFAGENPIGILRRQGLVESGRFWPRRSAFGWNARGESVFIDAREFGEIDGRFDKYTEMLQAGPLLLRDGQMAPNTENIKPNVLDKRHPRTVVGTDGKRIMWAVFDGRNNMHSVGATIEETRKYCRRLGMTTALNLDGGGSSSLWWRGGTFTLPSNSNASERPIPYAILIFQEGALFNR